MKNLVFIFSFIFSATSFGQHMCEGLPEMVCNTQSSSCFWDGESCQSGSGVNAGYGGDQTPSIDYTCPDIPYRKNIYVAQVKHHDFSSHTYFGNPPANFSSFVTTASIIGKASGDGKVDYTEEFRVSRVMVIRDDKVKLHKSGIQSITGTTNKYRIVCTYRKPVEKNGWFSKLEVDLTRIVEGDPCYKVGTHYYKCVTE